MCLEVRILNVRIFTVCVDTSIDCVHSVSIAGGCASIAADGAHGEDRLGLKGRYNANCFRGHISLLGANSHVIQISG